MDLNTQRQKAEAFRRMHDRSRILAWLLERVGRDERTRGRRSRGPRHRHQQCQRSRIRSATPTASPAPRGELVAAIARNRARGRCSRHRRHRVRLRAHALRTPPRPSALVVEAGAVGIGPLRTERAAAPRRAPTKSRRRFLERLKAAREAAARRPAFQS